MTTLGRNFVGHEIAAVFKAIQDAPALQEKSEFESTAAYRARRDLFITRPLFASLMPTGLFAFVIEDSASSLEFTYDADELTMKIVINGRSVDFFLPHYRPAP